MAETAAHLLDEVFPPLPVRQWVLSVPKRLCYFLQHEPVAISAVLHIVLRVIEARLRQGSGHPEGRLGAVSFVQRFGSDGCMLPNNIRIETGTISGYGVVEAMSIYIAPGADLRPGNTPGVLTFDGDLTLDGTYCAEVTPSEHDQLVVLGAAILGPTSVLDVVFDSFQPQKDARYELFRAASVTGSFGALIMPDGYAGCSGSRTASES